MTDQPIDRAAIRQRARAQVARMGLRVRPEPEDEQAAPVKLPTLNFRALQALMNRGHLTEAQATEARRLFAEARQMGDTPPEDTA